MKRLQTEPQLPRSGNAALAAGALIQAVLGAVFVVAGLSKVVAPDYTEQFMAFVEGSAGARSFVIQTLVLSNLQLVAQLAQIHRADRRRGPPARRPGSSGAARFGSNRSPARLRAAGCTRQRRRCARTRNAVIEHLRTPGRSAAERRSGPRLRVSYRHRAAACSLGGRRRVAGARALPCLALDHAASRSGVTTAVAR